MTLPQLPGVNVEDPELTGETADALVPDTPSSPGGSLKLGDLTVAHNGGHIDVFMAGLRLVESGSAEGNYRALGRVQRDGSRARGAYQIMDKYWSGWAAEAGIPGADWRDPQAQDFVARYKITQYFNELRDWRLVAVAWFGGLGRARQARDKGFATVANLSDSLGTSIAAYVNKVSTFMEETAPGSVFQAGVGEALGRSIPTGPDGVGRSDATDMSLMGPGFQFFDPLENIFGAQGLDNDPESVTGRQALTHIIDQMSRFVAGGDRSPLGDVADDLAVFDDAAAEGDLRTVDEPEGLP